MINPRLALATYDVLCSNEEEKRMVQFVLDTVWEAMDNTIEEISREREEAFEGHEENEVVQIYGALETAAFMKFMVNMRGSVRAVLASEMTDADLPAYTDFGWDDEGGKGTLH
jgi:hypothetical protein